MSTALPPPPQGYLPVQRSRISTSALILWALGAFVVGILTAGLVASVIYSTGADPFSPIGLTAGLTGQFVGSLLMVVLFSRIVGTGSLAADVGLVLRGKDWWVVLAGMGLQVVVLLINTPFAELLFPDGPPSQGVADIAGASETTLEVLGIFLSVAVLAPIIEEIIYRGMVLPWLGRFMGRWPSILVSAAIFSLIHPLLDWDARAAVPGLFIVGVVLGWAALHRGDLSMSIALHSGFNLLAAFFIVWGADIIEWLELRLDELEQVDAVIRLGTSLIGG
jgi:membrane protease YdiL (CAAX protease family)